MEASDSSSVSRNYAEIIVIRHGETAWNAEGRIQGHKDVELNELGRRQAAIVADRLSKEPKIDFVYSSDLKRALETAEIISSACGGPEVIQNKDLRERNLGGMEGVVRNEGDKVCPEAYKALCSGRRDQEIPGGGESLDQLYLRCTSAVQKIGRKHKGKRIVIVSHGGTIRALYKRARPNSKPPRTIVNTSINVFHVSDNDKWTLKVWGDISHLEGTEFLDSGFGGDKTSG